MSKAQSGYVAMAETWDEITSVLARKESKPMTTKSTHTPGPWRAVLADPELCVYGGPDDIYLAKCYGDPGFLEDPERQANARLIAAAPEMAAFLVEIQTKIPATPSDYADRGAAAFTPEARWLMECQNKARALLARIEG